MLMLRAAAGIGAVRIKAARVMSTAGKLTVRMQGERMLVARFVPTAAACGMFLTNIMGKKSPEPMRL